MNALSQPFAALILSAALLPWMASAETPAASSNTVIGPNVMLADGAEALMRGDWTRGVQLTQMGLTFAVSQQDRASALANLCAGFAALKQYQRALEHCDQSIALVSDNWRTWQNRAAANLGLGKIEESLRDIQRGLQLNPDSDSLQKTLAIARDHEKLQQERMRHLLES
jgi:tetratricopeptide (TPR) repeat protein